MTQALVRPQTFAVTFLSPIHIGTEERLDEHDFVYENGHLIRFRITPILERMGEQELERFVNEGLEAVKDWLRQSGLWQQLQLYQSAVPRQPRWNASLFVPSSLTHFYDLTCPARKSRGRLERLSLGGC